MKNIQKFIFGFSLFATSASHATPLPIIELFTSLNCPACPPADAYAKTMHDRGEALVLSYHVDYWNSETFTDPFSHYSFTERQYDYSNTVGERPGKVFTPQMVIDGAQAVKPPLTARVPSALKKAGELPKKSLQLHHKIGGGIDVRIPKLSTHNTPIVWLVGYNSPKELRVKSGIHRGRKVTAVNTVMYLAEIPYNNTPTLTLQKSQIPKTDHIAIMVQEIGPGRILALGTLRL